MCTALHCSLPKLEAGGTETQHASASQKILFSARALLHHSDEREIPLTAEKNEGREKSGGCSHGEERTGGLWGAAGGRSPLPAGGGGGARPYGFGVGVSVRDLGCWGRGSMADDLR
jgi:hypothetical protein